MLTFEFPDPGKADYFVARLQRERHQYAKAPSGKVVDVELPASDDPSVTAITHDYLVMLARHFGAYDLPKGPERLYTLHTWDRDDEPRHTEVSITTLAEFFDANPEDAAYIREHHPDPTVPSAFEGGGGAAPRWRLTRTPFMGRRDETGIPQQRVFRREA